MRMLVLLLLLAQTATAQDTGDTRSTGDRMTQPRLVEILQGIGSEHSRPGGASASDSWLNLVFEGVPMACISDPGADRMRITAPVAPMTSVPAQHLLTALQANFHSALDVRYAVSDGVIHVVYIHPLSPLTEGEVKSAVRQVATAVKTFGTTFTSGELLFPGQSGPARRPDGDEET